MLDYEGFNFPDKQVMRDWTALKVLITVIISLAVIVGTGILAYTIWKIVDASNRNVDVVEVEPIIKTSGLERMEVEPFSVTCAFDIPTAVVMSPDGQFLFSGGGKWGYIDPSTRARFAQEREAAEQSLNDLQKTVEETRKKAPAAPAEKPADYDSSVPNVGQSFSDIATPGAPDSPEVAEDSKNEEMEDLLPVDTSIYSIDRTKTAKEASGRLSDGSLTQERARVFYTDYLQLGKNGQRTLADMSEEILGMENEEPEFEVDASALSDLTDPSILPDLEVADDLLNIESNEERRERIWKAKRPAVESYPVAVWSVKTMEPLVVFWDHEYPISAISAAPDGKSFLSVDIGGTAILWSLVEVEKDGMFTEFEKQYNWVLTSKMTPDARCQQGMGRILSIYDATFTPSGDQFVLAAKVLSLDESGNIAGDCGALILWDIPTWKEVLRNRPVSSIVDTWFQTVHPVGKFDDLAFSPNGGKYLICAASGTNSGVYWFNIGDSREYGKCMANTNKQRQGASLSYLDATSTIGSNLVLGVSEHEYPNAEYVSMAISKDGKCVVSADNLGRIVFWRFDPGTPSGVKCLKTIEAEDAITRGIRKVVFSADDRYIILSGEETLVFNYGKNFIFEYLGDFQTSGKTSFSVLDWWFTIDSNYLFTGCDDSKIRVWRMDELPIAMRYSMGAPAGTSNSGTSKKSEEDSKERSLDEIIDDADEFVDFDEKDKNPDLYDSEAIDNRLDNEIRDPLSSENNRSLNSHNPLEKRLQERTKRGRN